MLSQESPLAVVVTADDFGIGVKTSEGIIEAHLNGPVTATSVMAITGDHVRQSIGLLGQAPNLDVGLHIVLTRCGHGPLKAGRSSGLVGRDGQFYSNGELWMKAFSGRLNKAAIVEEIAAQAELFRSLLGRGPTHVDSHHHAHQLPAICEAMMEVMAMGLLPAITRKTTEPPGAMRKIGGMRMKRLAAGYIGKRAAAQFSVRGIASNDFFIGMIGPRDLALDFPCARYFAALPSRGVVEWVVHPGLLDETLIGRDDYVRQRADELIALAQLPGMSGWESVRGLRTRKSVLYSSKKR